MLDEITRLSNVIELLRQQLNKDLPSQHIAMLLAVARKPGVTMPELCAQLDMPQGTVSRNVKLMAQYCDNSGKKVTTKGYGLLATDQAPSNRYQLAVFLTAEGEQLVQKLARMMAHEHTAESPQNQIGNEIYGINNQAC